MDQPKEARISYRGTPEQRKRLKALAVERDTSVQQILDEAVQSYLTPGDTHANFKRAEFVSAAPHLQIGGIPEHDPTITPQSDHERDLVAGLLLLFRDKREIAQGVKEIVAGLLSVWINKAKAAMPDLNGGKRSA